VAGPPRPVVVAAGRVDRASARPTPFWGRPARSSSRGAGRPGWLRGASSSRGAGRPGWLRGASSSRGPGRYASPGTSRPG